MSTTRNSHQVIKALNHLLLANDYQKIVRLTRCRNWMNYNTLHETQKCNLLSWLLCPTEGHGLGDYFIKQLLRAVYQAIEPERIKKLDYFSAEDALISSFSNALVTTELRVEAGKRKEGRIDLLIYDEFNSTLIVIERKDGSRLSKNQLQKYQSWCEEHYPSTTKYYLLLDSYENRHDVPDRWVQLNDDWLIQGMQNLLDSDQLPSYIEQQFKDLLDYVFADWSENHDPAYKQRQDLLLNFVQQHHGAIEILQTAQITYEKQFQKRLVDLNYNDALKLLSPSTKNQISGMDRSALLLFMQHFQFLHEVLSVDLFEKLEKEFNEQFPELKIEHFGTTSSQGLYLIHEKHFPNPEVDETPCWPYYLEIAMHEKQIEDAEDSLQLQSLVSLTLYVDPRCLEEQLPIYEKVRNAYGLKINGRKKPLHKNPFIGKEFLSLDNSSGIKPLIEEFVETVSKIKEQG